MGFFPKNNQEYENVKAVDVDFEEILKNIPVKEPDVFVEGEVEKLIKKLRLSLDAVPYVDYERYRITIPMVDSSNNLWELTYYDDRNKELRTYRPPDMPKDDVYFLFSLSHSYINKLYIYPIPLLAFLQVVLERDGVVAFSGYSKEETVKVLQKHKRRLIETFGLGIRSSVKVYVDGRDPEWAKEVARILGLPCISFVLDGKKGIYTVLLEQSLEEARKTFFENMKTEVIHPYRINAIRKFYEIQFSKPEWIVENLIYEGCVGLIVGRPRTGKTTLALNLARSILKGDDFLGRKTIRKNVLYLCYEKVEAVTERIQALGIEEIFFFDGSQGNEVLDLDAIRYLIEYHDIGLVIIDPLIYFIRFPRHQDLSDYGKMYSVISEIKKVAREKRTAFLLLHHATKFSKFVPVEEYPEMATLGSTGLTGGADLTIILFNTKEMTTMTIEGTRIPQRETYAFKIQNDFTVFVSENAQIKRKTDLEIAKEIIVEVLKDKPLEWNEMFALLTFNFPEKKYNTLKQLLYRVLKRLDKKLKKEGKKFVLARR